MKNLLAIFLCFVSSHCIASEIYIGLEPMVRPSHVDVRLGDIATVFTNSDNLTNQIKAVSITKISGLGKPVRLNQEEIELVLVRKMPDLKGSISWGSVNSTLLLARMQDINISSSADEAGAWILRQAALRQGNVKCDLLDKSESIAVPMGDVEQLPVYEQARWTGKVVTIPVNILVNGVLSAKRIMHFQVSAVGDSVSQTHQIEDRHIVSLDNSKYLSSTLTKKRGSANVESSLHHLIPISDLDEVMVQKDQRVKLILQTGFVSIESEGIAQASAALGEMVTVKRVDNFELLVGQVSDLGQVVIKD